MGAVHRVGVGPTTLPPHTLPSPVKGRGDCSDAVGEQAGVLRFERPLGEMLERTDVRCYRAMMARCAAFWTALAERSGDSAFERAMAIG